MEGRGRLDRRRLRRAARRHRRSVRDALRLLLDTHAAIWSLTKGDRLGPDANPALVAPDNQVLLSVVVAWEIAIKRGLEKLNVPAGLVDELLVGGARPLVVRFEHAAAVERLPLHHRDPFDRLLVAQAQVEGAAIVSADPVFRAYDVPVVW